ncbi:MAG TPA: PilZ domain-containing protein [Bryobacteraceae bacterium]|nr:PilZ domain-containing protein [Bryobacteraceae bacterium]
MMPRVQIKEKRQEERRRANGFVRVTFFDPQQVDVTGRLIDVSQRGFRMEHQCASLSTGQVVEFSHAEASGRARVMWKRIMGERVESGFLVLQPEG